MENYWYEENENEEKLPFWWYVKTVSLMLLAAAVAIFLMLFIFPTPVGEGVVTDKKFTAAHDEYRIEEYLVDNGYFDDTRQYRICRHYPNVWQITVCGDDWFGRKRTEEVYVLRERYDSLKIGDPWKWTGGLDYSVPPEYWEDPIFPDIASESSGTGYHVIPHVP